MLNIYIFKIAAFDDFFPPHLLPNLHPSFSYFLMSSLWIYNVQSSKDKENNIASDGVQTILWE